MKVNSLLVMTAFAVITFFTSALVQAESTLSLTERVEQLERQAQTRNQIQSDMSIQLVQLQKEVKELRGIIEEHEYKLGRIRDSQRDLYREIENRVSAPVQANVLPDGTVDPAIDGSATSAASAVPTGSAIVNTSPTPTPDPTAVGDGRVEYDAAFKLVRNKQYAEAIASFEAFLKIYPATDYSDNAIFWMGQVYYAESKYSEAEQQFLSLKAKFPKSQKIAASIVQLANIKVSQQKWQEAKVLFNEVVAKYTGSSKQLARTGLQKLKKAGH